MERGSDSGEDEEIGTVRLKDLPVQTLLILV